MKILEDLKHLKDAEDFFNYFNVEYDEHVVKPYRLHILKKFSIYMEEVLSDASEEEIFFRLRNCLIKAYQDFLYSTPIQQRLFKVHKDVAGIYPINFEIGKSKHE